jgi:hypothetical protein
MLSLSSSETDRSRPGRTVCTLGRSAGILSWSEWDRCIGAQLSEIYRTLTLSKFEFVGAEGLEPPTCWL